MGPRHVTIGEVISKVQVEEGTAVKGEMKNVKIGCVCTDNRVGRLPEGDRGKQDLRFIYVADCTAFMSIGVNAAECGIKVYDLPESECSESARTAFRSELSGDISWVPTKRNPRAPTFFLNNATIEKKQAVIWDADTDVTFPTSDVCRMMSNSRFATSSLFTTTGICGKVELANVNDNGAVVCALEDPVGYAVLEISIEAGEFVEDVDDAEISSQIPGKSSEEQTKDGKEFMELHGVQDGFYLFVAGELQMELLDNNAYLAVKGRDVHIEIIPETEFARYVKKLLSIDSSFFLGVQPEEM